MSATKLLTCRSKRPDAKVRLFCFPWSGCGATAFTAWSKELSETVEVVGVTLAGRETRYKETCCYSAMEITKNIAEAIHQNYPDKPFFFFGHSFGALLCQEVASTLRAEYAMEPTKMYISGEAPPHSSLSRRSRKNYRDMSETEFKQAVQKLGCLPPSLITNEELLKVYLPALRADLTVLDEIVYDLPKRLQQEPLRCPLTVFEAVEDIDYDIEGWKQLTKGTFSVQQFPGAHFYLKDQLNLKRICHIISDDAASL